MGRAFLSEVVLNGLVNAEVLRQQASELTGLPLEQFMNMDEITLQTFIDKWILGERNLDREN